MPVLSVLIAVFRDVAEHVCGPHDDRRRKQVGEQGRRDKTTELGHHAQVLQQRKTI